MKLVSIAERKQFRICKMQKHKITKMKNYKNAKLQKCKKVLNQFFQLTKKTHIFCGENEEGKPKIGAVHCAQMCRKYTPKGKMRHPKRRNGIPQMAKWDTPNGEMGHPKRRNGIPQMVKWDIPKGEMGYPKW